MGTVHSIQPVPAGTHKDRLIMPTFTSQPLVRLGAASIVSPLLFAVSLAMPASPAQAGVVDAAMRARVDAEIAALIVDSQAPAAAKPELLDGLPPPVRRYFAYTGADKAVPARFTRFRFTGEVRLPMTGDASGVKTATPWMPLEGEQYMTVSTTNLGYVWDTTWTRGDVGRISVRDLYTKGDTHIWARQANGQDMVDEGHHDINKTYMVRFFAEATQSPTMLLPSAYLRWEPVSDSQARMVVNDRGQSAQLLCDFATDGALTQCRSDDRMLRFSGQKDKWFNARWVMKRGEYRTFGALRVPSTLEVGWQFPGDKSSGKGPEDFAQVRARITEIDHDLRAKY